MFCASNFLKCRFEPYTDSCKSSASLLNSHFKLLAHIKLESIDWLMGGVSVISNSGIAVIKTPLNTQIGKLL